MRGAFFMKHSFSLTAAALAVTILAVYGLMLRFCEPKAEHLGKAEGFAESFENCAEAAARGEPQIAAGEGAEKAMFLRSYGGKLALFEGFGRYPSKVYDLWVRSLPAEDQSRLAGGIEISSDEELKSLLEDLLS